MYESLCVDCNPGAREKGELKDMNMDIPSVYVGETSRSIYERAKEHWEAWKSRKEDSQILKNWSLHHGSTGVPNFAMKIRGYHLTSLSRQVGEAVRIRKRELVLNIRGELNRCNITRLSQGLED